MDVEAFDRKSIVFDDVAADVKENWQLVYRIFDRSMSVSRPQQVLDFQKNAYF